MSNRSNRATDVEKGLALLTVFSPVQRAMVIAAISAKGNSAESEVHALAEQSVMRVAPLAFVRADNLEASDILSLLVGLKAIISDALRADWTRDQYALAIEHTVKVPSDLAASMAANVVTEDTDAASIARSMRSWIPNIPLLPFDDVASGAVKLGEAIWANLVPKDYKSRALDAAYEWLLLGQAIRQLAKRQLLTDAEEMFEREASAVAAAKPEAVGSIIQLVSSLQQASGRVANAAETGDVDEIGDVHEFGELLAEGTDLLNRAEQGDISEDEIGGFGSKVKNFLKKAAKPLGALAGAAVGMPGLGAKIGGSFAKMGKRGGRKTSSGSSSALVKTAASIARGMGADPTQLTYPQVIALLRQVDKL